LKREVVAIRCSEETKDRWRSLLYTLKARDPELDAEKLLNMLMECLEEREKMRRARGGHIF